MHMHFLFLGILLGLGAAIPFGPVNLEMTRRHLRYGTPIGMALGFGACTADLTYLILLCLGALIFLQHALLLKVIGVAGSCVLIWFGVNAIRSPVRDDGVHKIRAPAFFPTLIEGYLITLLNPFTILFWASVSSQISITAKASAFSAIYAGIGVIVGTVSWVIFLNTLIHYTRHKLSAATIHRLNILGGIILLIFASLGIIHAFFT